MRPGCTQGAIQRVLGPSRNVRPQRHFEGNFYFRSISLLEIQGLFLSISLLLWQQFQLPQIIFAFLEELPGVLFQECPWKRGYSFVPSRPQPPFTHRVVWLRAWSGSILAGLSVEQLEGQELTAAPLLAFVSTGSKGGNPVTKWVMGQLRLVLLHGRLRLDVASLESCPTASLSGAPSVSCLWL